MEKVVHSIPKYSRLSSPEKCHSKSHRLPVEDRNHHSADDEFFVFS